MSATQITQGTPAIVWAKFRDLYGRLADPDAVTFAYSCGSFGPSVLTYTSGTQPQIGTIWRVSQGYYGVMFDTRPMTGAVLASWEGTGSVQAAANVQDLVIVARAV